MNSKQLAAIILVVGIALALQLALSLQQSAQSGDSEAEKANSELEKLKTQLDGEKSVLASLRDQSDELIKFTDKWEPFFAILEEQEEAETSISWEVRKSDLLNLSQRYLQIPHMINNKANDSLPILVQASLLFDDSYPKLLNWMGRMERIKPTMRVGRVALASGSQGNDVRMELVLEVPLLAKKKDES